MSLTSIVRKAIIGISAAAALSIGGCEKGTVKITTPDYNGDGINDRVATWYDAKGNKTKEKILLGGSKPIICINYFNNKGIMVESTFDKDGDGKPEVKHKYDTTGRPLSSTYFGADGKPGRIPADNSATCTDGLRNAHYINKTIQWEDGVDCGGPCPPCTADVISTTPATVKK